MKKNSYRVVEAPDSPLPSGFLINLPRTFNEQGTTIYKQRNEVKRMSVNGQTLCVKKYGISPLLNRFLYSLGWRTPKAQSAYQNAAKILARGFCTPAQYGYVLVFRKGWLAESYSVGEFVENMRSMEALRHEGEAVRALARYTARLHDCGLMHRDYILNNVLCAHSENGYKFVLIDVNRFIFRNRPIRGFLRRMNLMQPFNKLSELKKFVNAYSQEVKAGSSLCRQVVYFRIWRTRYSKLKRLLKKLPVIKSFYQYRLK